MKHPQASTGGVQQHSVVHVLCLGSLVLLRHPGGILLQLLQQWLHYLLKALAMDCRSESLQLGPTHVHGHQAPLQPACALRSRLEIAQSCALNFVSSCDPEPSKEGNIKVGHGLLKPEAEV